MPENANSCLYTGKTDIRLSVAARMVKSVNTVDLKSAARKGFPVQFWVRAPSKIPSLLRRFFYGFLVDSLCKNHNPTQSDHHYDKETLMRVSTDT